MDKTMFSNNARYFIDHGFKEVNGWLSGRVTNALDLCVSIMCNHNHQWADTLEIGVHEGKFFIPLERVTPDERDACAIDVFDLQQFNIDKSGLGNLQRFQDNVARFCRKSERVQIVKGDSFDIYNTQLGGRNYSLISIDGGHTVQHVLHDMEFAAEKLQAGGIIILDDFPNVSWLGVLEGITLYFHRSAARVAPFAAGYNKLFITTVSYQRLYMNDVRKFALDFGLELGRITQFCGWDIQALAARHFMPK